MDRIPVISSNVASIGYCTETGILEVEFNNGGVYQYFGIPEFLYNDFLNADSKGRFLNTCVKQAGYNYAKVG